MEKVARTTGGSKGNTKTKGIREMKEVYTNAFIPDDMSELPPVPDGKTRLIFPVEPDNIQRIPEAAREVGILIIDVDHYNLVSELVTIFARIKHCGFRLKGPAEIYREAKHNDKRSN